MENNGSQRLQCTMLGAFWQRNARSVHCEIRSQHLIGSNVRFRYIRWHLHYSMNSRWFRNEDWVQMDPSFLSRLIITRSLLKYRKFAFICVAFVCAARSALQLNCQFSTWDRPLLLSSRNCFVWVCVSTYLRKLNYTQHSASASYCTVKRRRHMANSYLPIA